MLKSKKPRGRGFTLAEIMIVLTVIGVLSAILLPVASNSMPDKNIIKFKKAHNTLATTIRSMISNDQYFTPGDFGKYPDGTLVSGYDEAFENIVTADRFYFGEVLADNLTHKKYAKGTPNTWFFPHIRVTTSTEHMFKAWLDDTCKSSANEANALFVIVLPDDTVIYHNNGREPFGSQLCDYGNTPFFCYRDPFDPTADFYSKSSSPTGFDTAVHPICIDIDGSGPIKGFGYGIRRDGKIVNGLRADWWLSRDITKKETDCCPKNISNVVSTSGAVYNSCDTSDTVCPE